MKSVLAAFNGPLSDGTMPRTIPLAEFSEMWKSCSDELKEILKAEASSMGF